MFSMLTAPSLTLLFLGVVVGLGTAFVWGIWEIEQKSKPRRNSDRFGPLHHFAAMQRFGRFRVKAGIRLQAGPADSVENDPKATQRPPSNLCQSSNRASSRAQV